MTSATGTELAIYTPFGEDGELSGLDSKLLEIVSSAGGQISAEQIAERLGVPSMSPARCAQRIKEILKSQRLLSRVEQKGLVLVDVIRLRDLLFERIEGAETKVTRQGVVIEVESNAALFGHASRLLAEWSKLIDDITSDVDSEKASIRRAHANIMLAAISVMFDRYNLRLEKELGIKLDRGMVRDIMEEVMPLGIASLEERIEE